MASLTERTVDPAIAVELERLLAPYWVKFLKLASHHYPGGNDSTTGDGGNFFLYLKHLMSPENILVDLTGTSSFYPENSEINRYLNIYACVDWRWLM
jgi:hypothetical protein